MNRLAIIASALPLLLLGASLSRTAAAAPALTILPQGNEVELSWTATSLTPTPPYQHYDFQLQLRNHPRACPCRSANFRTNADRVDPGAPSSRSAGQRADVFPPRALV